MEREYCNPIIPGFNPDPSICRVGIDYYLVTSSFEYFPGIPIYHSRDLTNWRQIGNVIDRKSQLPLENVKESHGIWAPTIRYHAGIYYVVATLYPKGNFMVTATVPNGTWSDPIWLETSTSDIDPSLFIDDDQKAYLTVSSNRQAEIDLHSGKVIGEWKTLWTGSGGGFVEGPHLYKCNGYYYLIDAEGGTGRCHLTAVARAKSPWGPFDACPHNPILTARGVQHNPVQCCGHADIFQDHNGNYWVVFLGIREVQGMFPRIHHLGRETFLAPLEWHNNWPVINRGAPITSKMTGALPEEQKFAKKAHVTDDFIDYFASRHHSWVSTRLPRKSSFEFSPIGLQINVDGCGNGEDNGIPELLLRRPAATSFDIKACVNEWNGEVGLTVRMNQAHHYDLVLKGNVLVFRRQIGDIFDEVTHELKQPIGEKVILGIEFNCEYCHYYVQNCSVKKYYGKALSRYLAIEVAGGFTGIMTGIMANHNSHALIAWFECNNLN